MSFRFFGTIGPEDYQQMLPKGEMEWWLCLVLAVLVAFCILVFGPFSFWFALIEKKLYLFIILAVFWPIMLGALWFLINITRTRHRADYYLRLHPDVLGTFQGEFDEDGLKLFDGIQHYWIGPKRLLRTAILAKGLRVHLDRDRYRYFACSKRLFEGYHLDSARNLKRQWSQLAQTTTENERFSDIQSWKHLGTAPEDAIHFHGTATTVIPWRNSALRRKLPFELGVCLLGGTLFLFTYHHMATWVRWCGVLSLAFGLLGNAFQWIRYFGKSKKMSWSQAGWISPQEFALVSDQFGIRVPLKTNSQKIESPDEVLLVMPNFQTYCIQRHMVANDEQWQQILALSIGA